MIWMMLGTFLRSVFFILGTFCVIFLQAFFLPKRLNPFVKDVSQIKQVNLVSLSLSVLAGRRAGTIVRQSGLGEVDVILLLGSF